MKDLSKISFGFFKKATSTTGILFLVAIIIVCFQIYVPINPFSGETITYVAQKGLGDDQIAEELEKLGTIRSSYFFRMYVVFSLQHSSLQAGKYNLSPHMSTYQIVKKFVQGDVVRHKITIFEGWDLNDIGKYFEEKGICKQDEFLALAKKDYSQEFGFLKNNPKGASLEGYIFPDTYEIAEGETCQDILGVILSNFSRKLTAEIRAQIADQKKSIFDIITMASLIEKEVRPMSDKKIVSGVMWKRLSIGMPLQLDCTINYITNKNDPGVATKDTKIDSPYNTYMYPGLPKGPISNPGMDSILAAINPVKTAYWFWLSDGITHFSKTLEEHNTAKAKYLY